MKFKLNLGTKKYFFYYHKSWASGLERVAVQIFLIYVAIIN